jgi:hypothetical protein
MQRSRQQLCRPLAVRASLQDETLVIQTLPFSPVILGQFLDFLGQLIELRRPIMVRWAQFLCGEEQTAEVIRLAARRA